MISTTDLVDALASDLKPTGRGVIGRRLALGLAVGIGLTAAVVMIAWGPRPDFRAAMALGSFWVKFAYAGLLATSGVLAVAHLSRPDGRASALWLGAATVIAMAGIAAGQLAVMPAAMMPKMIMGGTAASCPWLIMLLSAPILVATLAAVRTFAPTRLRAAGAAAGLAAGGAAAFVYAISCDERGLPFTLIWYGLGIAAPTVIGALAGPRILRW